MQTKPLNCAAVLWLLPFVLMLLSCENNNPTYDTRGNERVEPGEAPGTSSATGNVERE
jgi:hypothetical protein